MKKYLFFLIAGTLFSCSTTVKRYKHIEKSGTDTAPRVKMTLFGTKIDTPKDQDGSKSLWDLDAEGQAEFIKEFADRNTDNDKFISSLNAKYLKPKEKTITDYTAKDLKLIFSIAKNRDYLKLGDDTPSFTLADRIEYLKFKITIPTAVNLKFIKWNKFTTEYSTIDVADVTFSQSLEASAGTGISNSFTRDKTGENSSTSNVNGFTPTINASGTISKTEAQKVRYRYVSLNGTLSDKEISVEQEGIREIDLNGNVIADVSFKFDEVPEILTLAEGYKTAAGAYNTPDKLKLSLYSVMVPAVAGLPNTIDATLEYEYAYRHVIKGADTFFEWDDTVKYFTGKDTITINLFTKQDYEKNYVPDFYNISKIGEDAIALSNRTCIIVKEVSTGTPYKMVFPSLAAAREFWDWLIRYTPAAADVNNPIIIGPYQLILRSSAGDTPLTKQLLTTLPYTLQVLKYYR